MKKYTLILRLALAVLVGPISSVYAQSTTTDDSNITPKEIARRQENIRAFFRERASHLNVVVTKTMPDGQVIDFVPRDPSLPPEQPAPPPPVLANTFGKHVNVVLAQTWLQRNPNLCGPQGTVPLVHCDPEPYLAAVKIPPVDVQHMFQPPRISPAPSNGIYTYHVQASAPAQTNYGTYATMNLWQAPFPETLNFNPNHDLQFVECHSLCEILVTGSSFALNTVEAGSLEDSVLNAVYDPSNTGQPCLFVFFTTNGYVSPGDYIGGYDTIYKGFIQSSTTVTPGMRLTPLSSLLGTQVEANFQIVMVNVLISGPPNITLHEWSVIFNGTRVGYFDPIQTQWAISPNGLQTAASQDACYGEVETGYNSVNADGMGSGYGAQVGDDGPNNYQIAAYMREFGKITSPTTSLPVSSSTLSPFTSALAIAAEDQGCYDYSGFFYNGGAGLDNWWYYGGPGTGQSNPYCHP